MAFSHEYTTWHLTANGWIAGDRMRDVGVRQNVGAPEGRVLSVRYTEKWHALSEDAFDSYHTELWRGSNTRLIERYLGEFGECPASIELPEAH